MGSISKAVRRIIPKEIQPILPIAASMFGGPLVGKFLGGALGTGIMSTLGGKALASGLTSAGVDLLTKGKVDPRTAAVSALMGGGGQYFKNVGQSGQFLGMELGDKAKSAFADAGTLLAPTEISGDGKFKLTEGISEDEVLSSLGKSASTAATAGGTISAYDAAEEAQRKYEEEMAGREADSAADRQSRIDYISRYMGMAGFSQSEIDDALSRYGYKTGGRVGFSSGGSGTLGDSMQDMKILIMKNQIIDAGGGGFGGKDLDDKTDDEIIEIYEGLFGQGKANGGRIGYRIGGGPVKSFIAKLLGSEPSEEVLNKMFEERRKEILSGMFDAEAGTGAYSMEQMQKADEMATKQAMQELEEFKERIGMELDNPPEGSVSDDMIDQIMNAREKSNRTPAERAREDILQYDSPVPMNIGDTLLDKFMLEDFQDTIKKQKEEQKEEGSRFADGGRIKYAGGGYTPIDYYDELNYKDYLEKLEEGLVPIDTTTGAPMSYEDYEQDRAEGMMAKGGRVNFAEGGIMNLKTGGMPAEMDLRPGGFVPIGVKEKADDVPARLSKNEFVMTADAVRAAGGGSVNKGAKRMYDLMHKLEARV